MKCRLFNIDFYVSYLLVAVISIAVIMDTTYKISACFFSVFIHECGHLLSMRFLSIKPKSISLRLFEFAINADTHTYDLPDAVITLSGPLFNLLFALVFYPFSNALCVSNLAIGLFNLLPLDTFDGGHALLILLTKRFTFDMSQKIIKVLSFVLLLPLFFVSIVVLIYSKYNYSLLLICLYLLTILFVK